MPQEIYSISTNLAAALIEGDQEGEIIRESRFGPCDHVCLDRGGVVAAETDPSGSGFVLYPDVGQWHDRRGGIQSAGERWKACQVSEQARDCQV